MFLGLFVRLSTRPITNFYACAPKVYTVCLMIILNSRQKLRKDLSNHQDYPLVRYPFSLPLGSVTRWPALTDHGQ